MHAADELLGRVCTGLRARATRTTRYGRTALERAAAEVRTADPRRVLRPLRGQAVWLGRLVAGGQVTEDDARRALLGSVVDRVSPWIAGRVVREGLAEGAARPYTAAARRKGGRDGRR